MKRILLTVLCILILTANISAQSNACGDNLTWTFEESSGTLTISGTGTMWGFTSSSYDVPWVSSLNKIKSVILENEVTSIGNYAFQNCTDLSSVVLGNGVTTIGISAFERCTNLNSVSIPNSVISINHYAFKGCINLTSVTIPNRKTNIGNATFSGCINLRSVIFVPENMPIEGTDTYIGDKAFEDCISLTSIIIPESVSSIGESAFYNCQSLKSITIPEKVNSIGRRAFKDCNNLTTLYYNAIACSNSWGLEWYALETVIIGDKVIEIPKQVFYQCLKLDSILIKDNVLRVGVQAFDETAWFNNKPDGIIYTGKALYKYKGSMLNKTSIKIKEGTVSITEDAFYKLSNLMSVSIPESVIVIDRRAFSGCGLTSITVSEKMISIGGDAFGSNLSSVIFNATDCEMGYPARAVTIINGSGVSIIKEYDPEPVFSGNDQLISVTIGNGVKSINDRAFSGCTGLTSISIPSSVENVGNSAFLDCSSLRYIDIPSTIKNIGSNAFKNTPWLAQQKDGPIYIGKILLLYKGNMPINTSITITEGTEVIAPDAFLNFSNLLAVSIPSSVRNIGAGAFYGCESLNSITIPENVSVIGSNAFSFTNLNTLNFNAISCDDFSDSNHPAWGRVKTVMIGEKVTKIPNNTFYSCTELTSITMGKELVSIGDYAFSSCNNLNSVTLEDKVKYIGKEAFSNCSKLSSVILSKELISIGDGAFRSSWSLLSISLGGKVKYIGKEAFSGSRITYVSLGSSLEYIDNNAFSSSSITSIIIPNTIKHIGGEIFKWCRDLTSITLGNSLESIGNSAFYGCSSLSDITSLNPIPPNISWNNTFDGVNRNYCKLRVLAGSKTVYATANGWKDFLNISELPVVDEDLQIETESNSANVSWTVSFEATNYTLSIYSNADRTEKVTDFHLDTEGNILRKTGINTTLSCRIENLDLATTYYFSLIAYNENVAIALSDGNFETRGESENGIEDINGLDTLHVYPNPTTDYFRIYGISTNTNLTLLNMNGKVILQKIVEPNEEISIQALPKGVYLIRVEGKTLKINKY